MCIKQPHFYHSESLFTELTDGMNITHNLMNIKLKTKNKSRTVTFHLNEMLFFYYTLLDMID